MQEQVGKIENAHAVLQMRLKWIEKKEEKTKKKLNRKEIQHLAWKEPWSVFLFLVFPTFFYEWGLTLRNVVESIS